MNRCTTQDKQGAPALAVCKNTYSDRAKRPPGYFEKLILVLILASALPEILQASQRIEIVSNNYCWVILLFTLSVL